MKLLIPFTNKSESFTHGVEFGRLLEKIERKEKLIMNNNFPVRIENKELLINTCTTHGYIPFFGKEYWGEWVEFIAIKNINTN